MSTAGQCQDVDLVRKSRGKAVKDVRVASHACQEQEYVTISIPIEIMQFDSIYTYKFTFVRGLVHIYLLLYESQGFVLGMIPFAFYNFYAGEKSILNRYFNYPHNPVQ